MVLVVYWMVLHGLTSKLPYKQVTSAFLPAAFIRLPVLTPGSGGPANMPPLGVVVRVEPPMEHSL